MRASSGNSTRSLKLGSSSTFISSGAAVSASSTAMERLTPARSLVRPPTAREHEEQRDEDEAEAHRKDQVHHTSTFETLDIQRTPTPSRITMPTTISQPIGVLNIGST